MSAWDDPRMPTLSGFRRRDFTAEAIRSFCAQIGASRTNEVKDVKTLEHFQRDDLNLRAPRHGRASSAQAGHRRLPVDQVEEVEVQNNPEDRFQFERVGNFCLDPDTTLAKLVFN